jgi:head-tail adaptor
MAGLLNASELTAMRSLAETMLPSTCTIQTPTRTSDGMGGFTNSWANTYTLVPCKLSAGPGPTAQYGGQFQVHSEWMLSVAFDQAIAGGNRAVVNSDTFEVVRVQDDHDFRILRRAELKRVDA